MEPLPSFRLADDYAEAAEAAELKSERARLRLLASLAAMLDVVPFAQLRPADLAAHAGLARSMVYHYFTDLATLTTEVLGDFSRRTSEAFDRMSSECEGRYGYPEMLGYLSYVLANTLRNRGIVRVLNTQLDQLPQARQLFHAFLYEHNLAFSHHTRAPEGMPLTPQQRVLLGANIASGFGGLLRLLFIHPSERMPMPQTAEDLAGLVEVGAIARHRQVYGRDPTAAALRQADRSFDPAYFETCLGAARAGHSPSLRQASMPRLRRMVDKVGP